MFLPASGYCFFDEEAMWEGGGHLGYYWSSRQKNESSAYYLYFNNGGSVDVEYDNRIAETEPSRADRTLKNDIKTHPLIQ